MMATKPLTANTHWVHKWGLVGVLIACAVLFLLWQQKMAKNYVHITIRNVTVQAEVADTPKTRERGLSGRTSLGETSGMLFVYDEKHIPTFWMKGMLIPLDFIWLNDNVVVDLTENVLPPTATTSVLPTYSPQEPVNRVLEVNAGFIQRYEVTKGDAVTIK